MGITTKRVLIVFCIAGVVVYFLIALVVVAAIQGWRAAERAGNEAATIQNMKTIVAVETQYFRSHDRRFATLQQLVAEQLVSQKFAGDPVPTDGYVLTLTLMPSTLKISSSYILTANPLDRNDPSKQLY